MKRSVIVLLLVVAIAGLAASLYSQANKATAKDPVCGLTVEKKAELSFNYKGETYYFCSTTDRDKFRTSPDRYLKKR